MSQQIQITGGAKVRGLNGVLTGTSGIVSSVPLGAANGVATLDSGGKVPVSQLPSSVVTYLGTWNAATNTPTLVNGTGDAGDMYICNVAGTVNFGAGPIPFAVGDWVLYGSGTWQKSSGQNGTVTSVGLSTNGGAITIGNSPITTSGVISANFNGTNLQYVNGAGNLTTFPTLITSIGLSMPSAFSVANSPLTANGTIAVTGAGTTAQYIRGDGSLATFPTIATEAQRLITEVYNETGATLSKGTVVYINGGHGNLPTITKALATGDATSAQTYGVVQVDITNMNNGYVVVIGSLTDLDTSAYVEGTQLYLSSTTAGAWTSVKQYAPAHLVYVAIVTRSHPTQGVVEVMIQNGFEMDELHNVSAQSPLNNQGLFYNTSTSLWENKSIATALGYTPADDSLVVKLAGTQTITGAKTFTATSLTLAPTSGGGTLNLKQDSFLGATNGYTSLTSSGSDFAIIAATGVSTSKQAVFSLASLGSILRTYTLPDATGTIALTSDIPSLAGYVTLATTQTITAAKTFSGAVTLTSSVTTNNLTFANSGFFLTLQPPTLSVNRTVTLPNGTGTLALTSDLTGYVTSVTATSPLSSSGGTTPNITIAQSSGSTSGYLSSTDWTTFNNKQNALTNPVTGTGTANYLPKFTGASTIGNSILYEAFSGIVVGGPIYAQDGTSTSASIRFFNANSGLYNASSDALGFITSGTSKMILSASGNLGLGVTPSAWASITKAIQIGNRASLFTYNNVTTDIGNNLYFNGTDYIYLENDYSTFLRQNTGQFQWLIAPSGTAGNAITFTQAMTLFSTGNLAIATTTDAGYKLDVNGTGRFSSTLNITTNGNPLFLNNSTNTTSIGMKFTNAGGNYFIGVSNSGGTGYLSGSAYAFNIQSEGAQDLQFGTNNINRLIINATTGAATFSSSVTAGGLVTASAKLEVNDINGIPIRFQDITAAISGQTAGYIGMSTSAFSGNNGDLVFYPRTSATSRILLMGGNVGIGTTNTDPLSLGRERNLAIVTTGTNAALTIVGGGAARVDFGVGATRTGGIYSDSTNFMEIFTSTALPIVFSPNASQAMRITSGGNVLIGTTTDAGYKLDVSGTGRFTSHLISNSPGGGVNAATFYDRTGAVGAAVDQYGGLNAYSGILNNNGNFSTGSSGTAYVFKAGAVQQFSVSATNMTVVGSVTATSFFESSDSRLKTLIQDNYQTKGIASITPKLYTKNGKVELGYYAQDFVGVLDSAVSKGSDDMLSLSYREVHTAKIYALEQEIKELKAKMN